MNLNYCLPILFTILVSTSVGYGEESDPYKELLERFEEDLATREEAIEVSIDNLEKVETLVREVMLATYEDVQRVERERQLYYERSKRESGEFFHPPEYHFSNRMEAVHEKSAHVKARMDALVTKAKAIRARSSKVSKRMIELIPDSNSSGAGRYPYVAIAEYSRRLSLIEKALAYVEKKVSSVEEEFRAVEEATLERYQEYMKDSIFDSEN